MRDATPFWQDESNEGSKIPEPVSGLLVCIDLLVLLSYLFDNPAAAKGFSPKLLVCGEVFGIYGEGTRIFSHIVRGGNIRYRRDSRVRTATGRRERRYSGQSPAS